MENTDKSRSKKVSRGNSSEHSDDSAGAPRKGLKKTSSASMNQNASPGKTTNKVSCII
jgi:hypothetical protein